MSVAEQTRQVVQHYRRTLEGLVGIPATEGNTVDVLRNGVQIFPAMLEAIGQATETVDLLSYIYWTGDIAQRFAATLCDRAQAGVRVRILLDAIGAARMNRDLVSSLEEAGCDVRWFRPPTTWKVWEVDHRTHRKVLICDEDVAFIGGVGIAEEWEGDARSPDEWRDTHFRVRGPAVDGLRAYFVPDDGLIAQLLAARERGVEIDVIVPGPHPHTRIVQIAGEGEYGALLEAGVRIWRYQPSMMHAKIMTVDGVVACVGSGNMDERSMRLNDEANLVVFDPPTVEVLDRHFAEDLAASKRVDPDGWSRRGGVQRAEEAVVDLFDHKL